MISRRNIRVKVMQTLYTVTCLENQAKTGEPEKILNSHFSQTKELLVYLTYYLSEIARYAEKDAHTRASKHLPSYEDLHVNTKIAGNAVLWKILDDASYKRAVAETHPGQLSDPELVKKAYHKLTQADEYKKYITEEGRDPRREKEIMEYIFEHLMLNNEEFLSHVEEHFSNWNDDGEMNVSLLDGFLKKQAVFNFDEMVSPDKLEFANSLLKTVIEKSGYLEELIIPKLKNWDPERIALLDMILMKMGVCEFLYFETIPPKVTINEYIDLAKEYSTPQSGQFVNGILDNIHKELVQQGKMTKTDFKKA